MSTTTVELRSLITLDGELPLTLEDVAVSSGRPVTTAKEQNITSPWRSIEVK